MPDIYYRIEEKDLAHGIKRWSRVPGYFSFDREWLKIELSYFRAQAMQRRGQTTGNEYRVAQINKVTKEETLLDD